MSIFKLKRTKSRVAGFGLGAAFLLAATAAPAATITVDSLADVMDNAEPCTLREAIVNANNNIIAATNGCEAGEAVATDNIVFDSSIAGGTIILGGTQLPAIGGGAAGALTITGPVTIDGAETSRIFTNAGPNTTLVNLTLENGVADGAGNPANSGGAILNDMGGVLTVNGGAMNDNTSVRAGGAIEEASGAAAGTTAITLNNVNFSGNDGGDTPGNGGVLHVSGSGDIVVNGGIMDSNTAEEGGALWNGSGTMTVDGSTNPVVISNNTAGCAATINGPTGGTGAGGGGLFNIGGTLTVMGDTTISGNDASGAVCSGGGINTFTGTTLNVMEGVEISSNTANRAGGGIESTTGSTTTITGATLSGNTANRTGGGGGGNGGAMHITGNGNADISNATISGNIAATEGGGLWNNTGTMTVASSTITGNTANGTGVANGGGGIFNNAGNTTAVDDADILNDGTGGTVNVSDSTISDNSVPNGSGSGGGILNNFAGTVSLLNTVLTGNSAQRAGGAIEARGSTDTSISFSALQGNSTGPNPGNGGGLHITGAGDATLTTVLVAGNTAAAEGGGLWNSQGTMEVTNVAVLNNTASGDAADQGGGGIFNQDGGGTVNVSNSRISGNVADGTSGSGGGILNDVGATTNVMDSEINANSAVRAGGGVENNGTVTLTRVTLGGTSSGFGNIVGTNPGNGGGLHTGGVGSATVNDSSVGFNTATEGGGLWNSPGGSMTVNNSTVSNNQSTEDGGGLYQERGGDGTSNQIMLDFVTVASNNAGGNGGGLGVGNAAGPTEAFAVTNSIIADNTAGMNANFDSSLVDFDDGSSFSGDSNDALGVYRLFGGVTATHPLVAGSDTIDSTDSANCLDNDQRGVERPDVDCDPGAFQLADNPVISVTNTNTSSAAISSTSNNVVVLGLTLANNSDDDVNVGGFSGRLDINNAATLDFVEALDELTLTVLVDNNGNGRLDSADTTEVDNVFLNDDLSFNAEFDGGAGEMFAAGDSTSYIMVVRSSTATAGIDWAMPIYAGGTLLSLLGLFSVGGLGRRTRWVLAVAVVSVGLAACGGSSGGSNDDNDDGQPVAGSPIQGDAQFIAFTLDQADTDTNDLIVGDGMPVRGPALTAATQ